MQQLETKGIGFQSLQESLDTTTSGGKLVFHVFATLAEFERDLIRERTQAGLAAVRARGRMGGRPKGRDAAKRAAAIALSADKSRPIKDICTMLSISRTSFSRTLAARHQESSSNRRTFFTVLRCGSSCV